MNRRLLSLLAVFALLLIVPFALAQETTPTPRFDEDGVPIQFDAILADLSTRAGTTVTRQSLTGFTWAAQDFGDASLGCPQEGQSYAQVVSPGYVFTLDYNGVTYDYRVAEDTGTVVFCSETVNDELTGTEEANNTDATPEASGLIECDSTLILLTYIGQRDYGFQPTADLTTFELGQFTNDFASMMAMEAGEEDMAMTEEADMTMTEEGATGTTADETVNTVTLQPGDVADEDPACTALRAEVEEYLVGELRGMTMESGN